MKDCRLVYHCRCRSAERRYAWDNGEKERRRATSGALMVWCFGYGGCKIETRLSDEKSDQGWDDLFYSSKECESDGPEKGWSAAVMQIQCYAFGSRGDATGWSIVERYSRLVLTPWEGSVIWRSGVPTSARRNVTPERGKGGDTLVGLTWILLCQKIKKIYVVDSTAINRWSRFKARWVNLIFWKHMQMRSSFIHLIT
jgi:hypothetical protein